MQKGDEKKQVTMIDHTRRGVFSHFIFEHRQRYCISTEAFFEFLVVLILLQLSYFMHFVGYKMYDSVHVTLVI